MRGHDGGATIRHLDAFPFCWPVPPGAAEVPQWTGDGFLVDGELTRVVSYLPEQAGGGGWDDDLAGLMGREDSENKPIAEASRRNVLDRLRQCLPQGAPVVLEVGCSSGSMLRAIREAFPGAMLMGAEYSRRALDKAAENVAGVPLVALDITDCPLPPGIADTVVILNVLEHIENDGLALEQVFRLLKPGGTLILEVPAGPGLYDGFDKSVGHWRRYAMGPLVRLCRGAGFEVRARSHLGCLLYPVFWLGKKSNRRRLEAGRERQRENVDRVLRRGRQMKPFMRLVFALEAALRRVVYLPVGIRCLLVCTKPG